jgi:hypothetical protein
MEGKDGGGFGEPGSRGTFAKTSSAATGSFDESDLQFGAERLTAPAKLLPNGIFWRHLVPLTNRHP